MREGSCKSRLDPRWLPAEFALRPFSLPGFVRPLHALLCGAEDPVLLSGRYILRWIALCSPQMTDRLLPQGLLYIQYLMTGGCSLAAQTLKSLVFSLVQAHRDKPQFQHPLPCSVPALLQTSYDEKCEGHYIYVTVLWRTSPQRIIKQGGGSTSPSRPRPTTRRFSHAGLQGGLYVKEQTHRSILLLLFGLSNAEMEPYYSSRIGKSQRYVLVRTGFTCESRELKSADSGTRKP